MHLGRLILLICTLQVALFSLVLAKIPGGLKCDEADVKCGLKSYYKDDSQSVFAPINFQNSPQIFYASKFNPANIDKMGGFYIDDNINFNFANKKDTQDKRFFTPYKFPLDPAGTPLQISQKNWSVRWEGKLYIKDTGLYIFFADIFNANFNIKLNGKELNAIPINTNFVTILFDANFLPETKAVSLKQGFYDISINFDTSHKDARFVLMWLNFSDPKKTSGIAKFANPTNTYEYMRVIDKDSFSWQTHYEKSNFNYENLRIIDGAFFIQNKPHSWKFNSPTLTKYAGAMYEYCLIGKKQDDFSEQKFGIYAKQTQTNFKDDKLYLDYNIYKLTNLKIGECFKQAFSASPAISLAVLSKNASDDEILDYFNTHHTGNLNDHFSALPAKFSIKTDEKNVLRAGKKASLNIIATDINDKISLGYNAKLTQKSVNLDGKELTTNTLKFAPHQSSCKNTDEKISLGQILVFNDGKNIQNKFSYNEAAKFHLNIVDDEFSSVDSKNYTNFNKLDKVKKDQILAQINEYGYECKGIQIGNAHPQINLASVPCYIQNEANFTLDVLPSSFEVNANIFGAHGQNFVYKNNKTNASNAMTATLNLTITPKNANGDVLKNFNAECYGDDLLVKLTTKSAQKPYFLEFDNELLFIKKENLNLKTPINFAFNFDKNDSAKSPIIINASDLNLSEISTKNSVNFNITQINSSQNVAFLHGKIHTPLHEGEFSMLKAKEYYGFYCEQNCNEIRKFTEFSKLTNQKMPAILNYYVNENHSEIFGIANGYESAFVGNEKSIFHKTSALKDGTRELVFKNNTQKEALKDKILPLLDKNVTWLENEPFWIRFYRQNNHWHGKSYNINGNEKDVGNFVESSQKTRKNRRIEW